MASTTGTQAHGEEVRCQAGREAAHGDCVEQSAPQRGVIHFCLPEVPMKKILAFLWGLVLYLISVFISFNMQYASHNILIFLKKSPDIKART